MMPMNQQKCYKEYIDTKSNHIINLKFWPIPMNQQKQELRWYSVTLKFASLEIELK
jgi:hypothetical protein